MNTLQKAGYITILSVLVLFSQFNKAKAQNTFDWPVGVQNPFFSKDPTEAAKTFNMLTYESERDNLIQQRFDLDWIDQIPGKYLEPPYYQCQEYYLQTWTNSTYNEGEPIHYNNEPLYLNYYGFNIDTIHNITKGTLKSQGSMGFPILGVDIYAPTVYKDGHGITAVVTGDNIENLEDLNLNTAQWDFTDMKPGDDKNIVPADCKLSVYLPYLYPNQTSKKNYTMIKILEFDVKNGESTLIYNINNDERFNKYLYIITKRESNPQGDAPIIKDMTLNGDVLTWDVEEANPKEIYATVDNGPKIPLTGLSGTKDLNITQPGFYTVTLYTNDYFNLSNEMTKTTDITTALPETTTAKYEIKAGPNPANTYTTIYTPENTNTTTTITDLTGRTLEKIIDNDGDGQTRLDMTNYNQGMYPATITYTTPTNTTETKTIKLIKQ